MRTHPRKNVITACVSATLSYLNIYFREVHVLQHQKFLLCSDGALEALSINELEAYLSVDSNVLTAANKLAQELLNSQDKCKDKFHSLLLKGVKDKNAK